MPFQPNMTAAGVTTASLAVTAASQTFTIPLVPDDGAMVRIVNDGTQVIHWNYGSIAAAVGTSTPMIAASVEVFTVPPGTTQISVIAAATGSTIRATVGIGS